MHHSSLREAVAWQLMTDRNGRSVDSRNWTIEVSRPGIEKEVLQDRDVLTIPELLPGWELAVAEIWTLSLIR